MLLAKSQWRFPPALQVLNLAGFPGLSFLVMLANVALAFLSLRGGNRVFIEQARLPKPGLWASVAALAVVAAVVGWCAVSIPSRLANTFTIAALTDMVNQDPAILYGPDGTEIGRRPKINITGGEADHGFIPGPRTYPVFDTPYGSVGIGVCWDRHRLFIVRELARNGAQIVLMPADDDFQGNAWFPAYHASDIVFRAAENRLAFATGTTSGLSMVVDPYGRIVAEGGVIAGETFTAPGQTLCTRWGDWFGWLMVAVLAVLAGLAVRYKR